MLFVSNKDDVEARHFGRKLSEERTDGASRNLAGTNSTADSRRSLCEKNWARLAPCIQCNAHNFLKQQSITTGESFEALEGSCISLPSLV